MLIDPNISFAIQLLWIGVGTIWFFRRHDEVPLIMSTFLAYVFSFRYLALTTGLAMPVDLRSFGFEPIDAESAAWALSVAVLGQSVLVATYLVAQRVDLLRCGPMSRSPVSARVGRLSLLLAIVIVPAAMLARSAVGMQTASGKSMGFEVSGYLSLFPFALIGVAVLIIAAWKLGAFSLSGKLAAAVTLLLVAITTFGPYSRFQFLGWMIAGIIIACADVRATRRVGVFLGGALVAVALFGAAGALRSSHGDDLAQDAWERVLFAEDANMLDGLALLRQVYPDMTDFRQGREHLEIFARPIPRSIWPGKPVGGYMNKLGLINPESGFTLGISQGLFGSFYEEGAIIGVVICSILYGVVIGTLVLRSARMHPLPGLLLRGCLCAAMIPLLRGGDLPGIYAWFGMAFWPCGLAVWWYRKELAGTNQEPQATNAVGSPTVSNARRRPGWPAFRRLPSDRNVEQ